MVLDHASFSKEPALAQYPCHLCGVVGHAAKDLHRMDVSGVGHTRRRQSCGPCVDHVLVITTWFKSAISDMPGVPIHNATNEVEVKPPTVDACAEDTSAKLNDGQSDRRLPIMPSLYSVAINSGRGARWAGVRTEDKKDGQTDR